MAIAALDHVNIRLPDIRATLAFLEEVLAMRVVPPPGSASTDRSAWALDAKGVPVLHIGRADLAYPSDAERPFTPALGSGAIHHVAFRCVGFKAMKQRLDDMAVPYSEGHVPQARLRQLFVSDPSRILFELNFFEEAPDQG